MLAEHNRTGPALAANPATFPLNDVSYLPTPHGPDDLRKAAKLVFFRMHTLRARHPRALKAASRDELVEPVGIEPTT